MSTDNHRALPGWIGIATAAAAVALAWRLVDAALHRRRRHIVPTAADIYVRPPPPR